MQLLYCTTNPLSGNEKNERNDCFFIFVILSAYLYHCASCCYTQLEGMNMSTYSKIILVITGAIFPTSFVPERMSYCEVVGIVSTLHVMQNQFCMYAYISTMRK